jgi:hypothetical protein
MHYGGITSARDHVGDNAGCEALVATAIWISPRAWAGTTTEIHPHVWAAVFLGGAICQSLSAGVDLEMAREFIDPALRGFRFPGVSGVLLRLPNPVHPRRRPGRFLAT